MKADGSTSAETVAILDAGLLFAGDTSELSATEGLYSPA
jgi:hypothetical protein